MDQVDLQWPDHLSSLCEGSSLDSPSSTCCSCFFSPPRSILFFFCSFLITPNDSFQVNLVICRNAVWIEVLVV